MDGKSRPKIRVAWWLSLIQFILVRYIRVDNEWIEKVQAAAAEGPVCFVLRNRSLIDFLCLRGLLKKHELPPLSFVTGLSGPTYLPVMLSSFVNDRFYTAVMNTYVRRLLQEGYAVPCPMAGKGPIE